MPKIIDDHEVYTAALNLFVNRGYEGATTKEIAAAAGIHEASLFRKYGTKAQLIVQAVGHQFSDNPLSRLVYSGDLVADLLAVVDAYATVNAEHGAVMPILLAEVPRHPDLAAALDTPWTNIQKIVHIMERYQAEGVLKPEPPLHSVAALIGPIMVSQMIRRAAPDMPVPDFQRQAYIDTFLSGRRA